MPDDEKVLYTGLYSREPKPIRPNEIAEDYYMRLRRTLEDGLFYDTCEDAAENWEDEWTFCPVCMGQSFIKECNDGSADLIVEHKALNEFDQ